MFLKKSLFAVCGAVLSLSLLAIPASAHHGGGHHGGRAAQPQSWYCATCDVSHTGSCPNACAQTYGCGHAHGGHHSR